MSPENVTTIPDDYACVLNLRVFKRTFIHERSYCLMPNGRIRISEFTVPGREFGYGLAHFLARGWPEPAKSANWRHADKAVRVNADDLYLCSRCGEFHPFRENVDAERKRWLRFRVVSCTMHSAEMQEYLIDASDHARLRAYAESRLSTNEFELKECQDAETCDARRRSQLRLHSKQYGGFVTAGNGAVSKSPEPQIRSSRRPRALPAQAGFIYLIKGDSYYKIGIAKNAKKRLSGIKTSCPFPVEVLKIWESHTPRRTEKLIHLRFQAHRVNREWFQLPAPVVAFLKVIEDIDSEFIPKD